MVEVLGPDRALTGRIEEHEIGVLPDLDRALPAEAKAACWGGGEDIHEPFDRQPPGGDALAVRDREQCLDPGCAIADPVERDAPCRVRLLDRRAVGDVVRRNEIEVVGGQPLPQGVAIGRRPERGRDNDLGNLEVVGHLVARVGQGEVVRTRLRGDPQAQRLRLPDVADLLNESGVIATVVAGITLGTYGRRIGMSARTQEALDTVWEFLAFIMTALVFLLVGLVITVGGLVDAAVPIAWGIAAVLVGRAVVIYGLLGGAARLVGARRGVLERGWLHVLFWSGLRGAVTVALALSLPDDFPQRSMVQSVAFGITLFTLIAQGGTIGWVVPRVLGARKERGEPPVDPWTAAEAPDED